VVASEPPVATGDLLRTGKLTLTARISDATNATFVAEFEGGARCVYKPIRGERPLWDFPDGTLADREVASYLISEALGWDIVPETVLRDGPFGPGMVQRWICRHDGLEDHLDLVDLATTGHVPAGFREILRAVDEDGNDVSLVHADDPRLHRIAVLDVVLNNADRKGGHTIEATDGRIYGVDHGICLHTDYKLRTVLWGWAGERIAPDLVAGLASMADALSGDLATALRPHLHESEIIALADRTRALLDDPVMPFPADGRSIPWPAF
jgi:uncharacterized repeat protein (TIGR03843 family)